MDQSDGNDQPAIILATRDVSFQALQHSRLHPDAISHFKRGVRLESHTLFQTELYRRNLHIIDRCGYTVKAQQPDHAWRAQYPVPVACINSRKDVAGKDGGLQADTPILPAAFDGESG